MIFVFVTLMGFGAGGLLSFRKLSPAPAGFLPGYPVQFYIGKSGGNFPDIRITFLLLEIQLYIVEYSSNILRVETDGSHHHICAVGNKICPCTMAWATHSDRKTWLHLWYHKTYIRSLSENVQPTSASQVLVI